MKSFKLDGYITINNVDDWIIYESVEGWWDDGVPMEIITYNVHSLHCGYKFTLDFEQGREFIKLQNSGG
jgi:hypothetical protein